MTYNPDTVFLPGETLKEMMEERSLSYTQLGHDSGIGKLSVMDICAGIAPITQEIAERLEKYFNVPAVFWLALESNYQQWLRNKNNGT